MRRPLLPLIALQTGLDRMRWAATLVTTLLVALWELLRTRFMEPGSGFVSVTTIVLAFVLANAAALLVAGVIGRLRTDLSQRNRELATRNAVIRAAGRSPDMDTVLREVLSVLRDATDLEAGFVWLQTQSPEAPWMVVAENLPDEFVYAIHIDQPVGQLYRTGPRLGQAVVVQRADRQRPELAQALTDLGGPPLLGAVPVISKGMVLGMLCVGSWRRDSIPTTDISLLTAVGEEVGGAVEKSWVYQAGRQQLDRMTALSRAALAINTHQELPEVLGLIAEAASQALDSRPVGLLIWDPADDVFVVAASAGLSEEFVATHRLSRDAASRLMPNLDETMVIRDLSERQVGPSEAIGDEGLRALLSIPLKRGDELIGLLNVYHKDVPHEFLAEEILLARSFASQAAVAISNALVYQALEEASLEPLLAIMMATETSHPHSNGHGKRVALRAVSIGEALGLSPEELREVRQVAILSHLGMLGVADTILQKAGPLTPEEWDSVKSHPAFGAEIATQVSALARAAPAVRAHHERFDGAGYPDGLYGEGIPLAARIVAVADAYEALTSTRPHRPAVSREEALETLRQGAGSQWDPHVVKAFLRSAAPEPATESSR